MPAPPAELLIDQIIDLALREDLAQGDITSDNLFEASIPGRAQFASRQAAVVSGLDIATEVFRRVDGRIHCHCFVRDGDTVTPGTVLMTVEGPILSLLKAERLALNFVQHLSGVATLTAQYVAAVAGTKARILHTRKTLPGLRHLEVQAVLHGGGQPHRNSLGDAVLIKDNHIQAAGGIQEAVEKIRAAVGDDTRIEVECDTLPQVEEAISSGADMVLLDNMPPNTMVEAVRLVDGRVITEASGGITMDTIATIARTGVDYISTSQITMSASAVDVGLDFI